jgi:hypothetical protein
MARHKSVLIDDTVTLTVEEMFRLAERVVEWREEPFNGKTKCYSGDIGNEFVTVTLKKGGTYDSIEVNSTKYNGQIGWSKISSLEQETFDRVYSRAEKSARQTKEIFKKRIRALLRGL